MVFGELKMAIIPADIEINKSLVSSLLHDQFQLDISSISLLGEGWDNVVFLVNDKWVFRFPRRLIAKELIEKEIRLLTLLKNRLPLQIPKPLFLGQPTTTYPCTFYGHELLKGTPGSAIMLSEEEYCQAAFSLGHFLKNLHAINIDDLGLSDEDFDYGKSKSVFDSRLSAIEKSYDLKAYKKKFDDICSDAQGYQSTETRLIHGDMYHRHLIFEKNLLSGIIDWGDCALGDPTGDLGIIYQFFPKNTRRHFFKSYGAVDEKSLCYARFIGLYFAVALLWFGYDRNDKYLIRTSLWTFDEI